MGNVSMRVEAYKGYENKEGSKTQGSSSLASFCPVIKKKESNVGVSGGDSTDAKETEIGKHRIQVSREKRFHRV